MEAIACRAMKVHFFYNILIFYADTASLKNNKNVKIYARALRFLPANKLLNLYVQIWKFEELAFDGERCSMFKTVFSKQKNAKCINCLK